MWRFIIALLFSLQVNGQILRPDSGIERHITDATAQICNDMFRGPLFQQPIVIIKYAPLYPRIVGITRELSSGWFIVDLNPMWNDDQLEKTLMHELVHVYQIYRGDLKTEKGYFIWKGTKYPFSTPYKTRLWEIDAENRVKLTCE